MGEQLRTGDVTTATDSITQYAHYCELRADGRDQDAAIVLKEIEEYNRYDCLSTRKLRDWLINRAIECSVPPLGAQPVKDGAQIEVDDHLERALAKFAGDDVTSRTPEQTAVAMIAAGARLPPPRGQAVLVGALRPAQQPGRRMGGWHRRFRRRGRIGGRRLAHATEGEETAASGANARGAGRRGTQQAHVRPLRAALTRGPQR